MCSNGLPFKRIIITLKILAGMVYCIWAACIFVNVRRIYQLKLYCFRDIKVHEQIPKIFSVFPLQTDHWGFVGPLATSAKAREAQTHSAMQGEAA